MAILYPPYIISFHGHCLEKLRPGEGAHWIQQIMGKEEKAVDNKFGMFILSKHKLATL